MSKFDFQLDPELTRQLEKLADYDSFAPKILDGVIPILERRVKAEVARHKVSGDLYASIKKMKAFKNKYGWFVCVTPTGTDEKGVRNAEKLAYLEYGTSKQEAKPVLTKALNDSRDEVTEKMQELFNEIVEGKSE